MPDHSLPVLFPPLQRQRWSCHSCGDCCRTLVGHLTAAERDRILDQDWEEQLGVAPVVRAGRSWVLNKHPNGACVFLDEQNRCRIHARFGESAKPLACRIFPFSVRATSEGWQASLRFDCPSVTGNLGAPLSTHKAWLDRLVGELSNDSTPSKTVYLAGRLVAQVEEIDVMNRRLLEWLCDPTMSMIHRLVGGARLVEQLSESRLKNVRGQKLADLVDILLETTARMQNDLQPPTERQRGMLRQSVLAHAEHVTLTQLRSGLGTRIGTRWKQLKAARSMLAGAGNVPLISGVTKDIAFERIEEVRPAIQDAVRIDDLLCRYFTARVEGGSVFGDGYYGWTILQGFSALFLSMAVAGWLARYLAAAGGRDRIEFQDAAASLGIVDRAATRLPALGTWAERSRIAYLLQNKGLSRLVAAYPMVDPAR